MLKILYAITFSKMLELKKCIPKPSESIKLNELIRIENQSSFFRLIQF